MHLDQQAAAAELRPIEGLLLIIEGLLLIKVQVPRMAVARHAP